MNPADSSTSLSAITLSGEAGDTTSIQSGLKELRVQVDSGAWQTIEAWDGVTSAVFSHEVSGLGEGLHTIRFEVLDQAGNVSLIQEHQITVDQTPPAVVVSGPTPDQTSSDPVSYTVTYTGASFVTLSPENVTVNATGTATAALVAVTGTGLETRTVTLSEVSGDGTLAISVLPGSAYDQAGNAAPGADSPTSATVDNTGPVMMIDSPTSFTWFNTDSVTLDWDSVDFDLLTSMGLLSWSGLDGTVWVEDVFDEEQVTSEGRYLLEVHGTDWLDNTGSTTSIEFGIDRTSPVVVLEAMDAVTSQAAFIVHGEVGDTTSAQSGLGLVEVQVNGGPWETLQTWNGVTSAIVMYEFADLLEGTHSIRLKVLDLAGNSSVVEREVIVDLTSPGIAVSTPTLSLTRSGPVSFNVTYTGASTVTLAPTDITLVATGTAAAGVISVIGSGTESRTVTLSEISGDGTLSISITSATAFDQAGNPAPASVAGDAVAVDNAGPVISIDWPTTSTWYNSVPVILDWSTTTVDLTTSTGLLLWTSFDGVLAANAVSDGDEVSNEGRYSLQVWGSDFAGNDSETTSVEFGVDLTSPILTLDPVDAWTSLSAITLSGEADDTTSVQSGLSGLRIQLDSGLWQTVPMWNGAPSGTFSHELSGLGEGPHTVRIAVLDVAGNLSVVREHQVTVDQTPPQFTVVADPSSAPPATVVSLTVTASEALAAPPTVTVNGRSAVHLGSTGNQYFYTDTLGSDEDGYATIVVVGDDLASNTATLTDTQALLVEGSNCYRADSAWCGYSAAGALMQNATVAVGPDSCLTGVRDRWYHMGELTGPTPVSATYRDGTVAPYGDSRTDVNFDLATSPNGVVVGVWDSLPAYGSDQFGSDYDIFMARSVDGGTMWSPKVLNTDAVTDNRHDIINSVATDKQGRWVATWGRVNIHPTDSSLNSWDIAVARSEDDGKTWLAPSFLGPTAVFDHKYDYEPQVRAGAGDNWLLAWGADATAGAPAGEGQYIRVSRSTDRGVTWANPATLLTLPANTPNLTQGRVSLATDGAGQAILVVDSLYDPVTSASGNFILTWQSFDDGETWDGPKAIPGKAHGAYPRVATDGAGTWITVWRAAENSDGTAGVPWDFDIYASRLNDPGSSWTQPVCLSSEAPIQSTWETSPDVAASGPGSFLVAWSWGNMVSYPTLSQRKILAVRSDDAGQTWGIAQAAITNGFNGPQSRPRIASPSAGKWLVGCSYSYALGQSTSSDTDIVVAAGSNGPSGTVSWSQPKSPQAPAAFLSIYTGDNCGNLTLRQCVTARELDGSLVGSYLTGAGEQNAWIRIGSASNATNQQFAVQCGPVGSSCAAPVMANCGDYFDPLVRDIVGSTHQVAPCPMDPDLIGRWLAVTVNAGEMVTISADDNDYYYATAVALYDSCGGELLACDASLWGSSILSQAAYANVTGAPVIVYALVNHHVDTSGWSVSVDCQPIPPAVATLGYPSVEATNSGPVSWSVNYSGAETITLSENDITVNASGATYTGLGVTGTGSERTITLSGVAGNGSLSVSLAAGTATNPLGVPAAVAGPSVSVEVDNIAPTVALTGPYMTPNCGGTTYYFVQQFGASASVDWVDPSDVILNQSGSATAVIQDVHCDKDAACEISLDAIRGAGTLSISIREGAVVDFAGNRSAAVGPSDPVNVSCPDNDDLSSATSVTCPYSITGDITTYATVSPGSSEILQSCSTYEVGVTGAADVWYQINVPWGPDPYVTIQFNDDMYYGLGSGAGNHVGFVALYKYYDGQFVLWDYRCGRQNGIFDLTIAGGGGDTYWVRIGSTSSSPNKSFSVSCQNKF